MRSALCLSGIVGGTDGKGGRGDCVDYELCAEQYYHHIVVPNGTDLFLQGYDLELESKLIELYRPLASRFEPNIDITMGDRGTGFGVRSKCYAMRSVMELVREYENKEGLRYDWLMLSRYDLLMLSDIQFATLEGGYLYVANFTPPRQTESRTNISLAKRWLHDLYVMGSGDMLRRLVFGADRDWFWRTSNNPHKALWRRVADVCGDPCCVVRYWGWPGQDFDLYRWRICRSRR